MFFISKIEQKKESNIETIPMTENTKKITHKIEDIIEFKFDIYSMMDEDGDAIINNIETKIENNIELNHVGADMGTTTISVISKNNEEINKIRIEYLNEYALSDFEPLKTNCALAYRHCFRLLTSIFSSNSSILCSFPIVIPPFYLYFIITKSYIIHT